MYKHLPKLVWTLAFLLGLYFLVQGFSLNTTATKCKGNSSEKCSERKLQTGINIHILSRHLLDFNK